MIRKVVFYLKGDKTIVISDNSESTNEELIEGLSENLSSDLISQIETKTDILLIRPMEVSAILIKKIDSDIIEPEQLEQFYTPLNNKRTKKETQEILNKIESEQLEHFYTPLTDSFQYEDSPNSIANFLKSIENESIISEDSECIQIDEEISEGIKDLDIEIDDNTPYTLTEEEPINNVTDDFDSKPIINIID